MKNYEYPLDYTWSHEEMSTVIAMFNVVEKAYEDGVSKKDVLQAYQNFKKIVKSMAHEKQIGRDFERVSGYVLYRVVKLASENDGKQVLKMESR